MSEMDIRSGSSHSKAMVARNATREALSIDYSLRNVVSSGFRRLLELASQKPKKPIRLRARLFPRG